MYGALGQRWRTYSVKKMGIWFRIARERTLGEKMSQYVVGGSCNMLWYAARTGFRQGSRNWFQKKSWGLFEKKVLFLTSQIQKCVLEWFHWPGSKSKTGLYSNFILLLSFWPTVNRLATPPYQMHSSESEKGIFASIHALHSLKHQVSTLLWVHVYWQ